MAELLMLLLLLLLLSRPGAASSNSSNNKYNHQNLECDWCPRPSTASISSSLFPPKHKHKEVLPHYYLAAASADLLRDGGACCYQLRCKDRSLCSEDGVKVVVVAVAEKTNNTNNGSTSGGFQLTRDAFSAMTMMMSRNRNGGSMSDDRLFASGLSSLENNTDNLQVQFRRIPCEYKKNLAIQVEDEAWSQHHLAIRFLYQGGLTDIAAVEVAQLLQEGSAFSSTLVSSLSWWPMTRRRPKQHGGGVVWYTARAPDGPLQLRLVVTAGSGGKWLRTTLPADWRPGGVYDTGLQITDVAVRACSTSCGLAGDDDSADEELR